MSFLATHRRLVISGTVVLVPLLTLLVAEGVAQMRLAGTMTETATRLLASFPAEQQARFQFSFDTLERFNWHYYYRVQGPTFLIEYMNTNGNHSHSVWRDFQNGDFGEDLLRAHYAEVPHGRVSPLRLPAAARHAAYVGRVPRPSTGSGRPERVEGRSGPAEILGTH